MKDNDPTRTHEQNKKFHAMCSDISKQLSWGGSRWNPEDWKRILLAAKFGQKVVQNPFGYDVVIVNKERSRDLSMKEMAELIGEIEAFGVMEGVKWTDQTNDVSQPETTGSRP